ncbi:protein kinase [Trypanosoma rangeli SC58]|uniref:Protein kinase n=1 Tax=Trypanosoma rangeli SC58 TaxID=429131 RepID=A0A061IWS8_TRYRA|nr:protein kinase [Trypanosoma rangeli SC58]
MEHYEILNQLGDGTFGCVVKALDRRTGQLVAIKKMKQKYYSWEECVKLPEVLVMRRIHGHPNIVKMREVVRENNELFFVFEYMDGDLLGVIRKAKQVQCHATVATAPPIPYPKIKGYIFQIFQSLAYLHQRGYFHRDMKPENLLVREDPISPSQEIVKLADFGLVKEIRARLPFTDYISTRWYRAPELLLQDRSYSSPVDIWAAGCILAELITTRPLFAGSNEVDQLHKIMNVLGSPNEQVWPEGIDLAKKIRYAFPMVKGMGLERVLPPHVPSQALDLMKQMLSYDPKRRPTARQCLQHPYFNVGIDEENFSPSSVTKQLANTIKKFASSPQSAPSGNVLLPSVLNVRRSPVGATTALPKQGSVGVPPLLSPT